MKIINNKINELIATKKTFKLNLGAGNSRIEGYFNLDIVELPSVHILADLNKPFDLLPDNSVDAIYTQDSFEHVKNFMGLMDELHRICVPEAEIHISVPHFSNPYYYSDPTHVRFFGLYTMHYFMDEQDQLGRKVPDFYTKSRFKLKKTSFKFYRDELIDKLLEPIVRRLVNINLTTQAIYERRFCYLYPAREIKYRLLNKK